MQSWESLIGKRNEQHFFTHKDLKIQDPSKRNSANATKRWRKKNQKHCQDKQKEWRDANPDKIKIYQERNKKNVKRWTEENPDRVRELGRKADRKRAKSPKRIAWKKAYEEKRKNDPKRIAWKKAYNEKKKLERMNQKVMA